MTIRAHDIALGHFGGNGCPREPLLHHRAHIPSLLHGISVIELEDYPVSQFAVETLLKRQVLKQLSTILTARSLIVAGNPFLVRGPIAFVVFVPTTLLARFAIALENATVAVLV